VSEATGKPSDLLQPAAKMKNEATHFHIFFSAGFAAEDERLVPRSTWFERFEQDDNPAKARTLLLLIDDRRYRHVWIGAALTSTNICSRVTGSGEFSPIGR
jgi:hypothetical protein